MNIMDLDFDNNDAEMYIHKSFELFGLMHSDISTFSKNLFERVRKDPLMFTYALIHILTTKNTSESSSTAIDYLQKNFNEIKQKLNQSTNLWIPAIYCLFLGMIGIRIYKTLLASSNVLSDDLVNLTKVEILFNDQNEFEVRHEEWAKEFNKSIIINDFNEDIDSFFMKYNLGQLLASLSNNLSDYEIVTFLNRLSILANEIELKDFARLIVSKFPISDQMSMQEKAEIYCFGYGLFYEKLHDIAEAKKYYEQATNLNPKLTGAHNNLANMLDNLGDLDGAMTSYDRVIELEPNDPIALYNKGRLLNKKGDPKHGLVCLENSIRMDYFYEWAYFEKGNSLRELDRRDEAINSYKVVIELNLLLVEPWISIGNILMEFESYLDSKYYFEKAKKVDSANPVVWYSEGLMYATWRNVSEAISHFKKALDLGLKDVKLLRLMYQYFITYNEYQSANTCLQRINNLP